MKLWDNVHFFSQCHMSNYRWVMTSTALMPLGTHPVIPQTSPHLPPSSQVAGTPVFQLQILPLAAVDIDAQREVTINRKERQGGWALMISHQHLGGRKGTGWDGGRGSYKYVTCNSWFFSKTPFHLFKPNSLSERLFSHSLIAEQQRPFPEGRSVPRATIHQDSAPRPLATNPPWSSPSQRFPPSWDTPSCPLSTTSRGGCGCVAKGKKGRFLGSC